MISSLKCFLVPSLLFGIFSPLSCFGDIDDTSYGNEEQLIPQELYPLKFGVMTDIIGKAELKRGCFGDEHLSYGQSTLNADVAFYYDSGSKEGALASLAWSRIKFHWRDNPFFDYSNFHIGTFALNGFSGRCPSWFWQGRLAINLNTNHFDLNYYATYDFLLWGRYDLDERPFRFHIGLLAQTGLKVDRVYPILGFDWMPSETWQVNCVFPMNISLLYKPVCYWTTGIAGRFFDTRFRTGKDCECPIYTKAIVEYRSAGVEGLIAYDDGERVTANLHVGYMATGKLKISNRHHDHGQWFDLDGAPYVGGEMNVKF